MMKGIAQSINYDADDESWGSETYFVLGKKDLSQVLELMEVSSRLIDFME